MSSTFEKDIGEELNAIKKDLSKAMSDTLVGGLGDVTSRAAVDTGRYRAAWNISKNTPDESVPRFKKKPKGHKRGDSLYSFKKRSRILFDVTKDKSIILSNNVEYAPYVDAKFGDTMIARRRMKAALYRRVRKIK